MSAVLQSRQAISTALYRDIALLRPPYLGTPLLAVFSFFLDFACDGRGFSKYLGLKAVQVSKTALSSCRSRLLYKTPTLLAVVAPSANYAGSERRNKLIALLRTNKLFCAPDVFVSDVSAVCARCLGMNSICRVTLHYYYY